MSSALCTSSLFFLQNYGLYQRYGSCAHHQRGFIVDFFGFWAFRWWERAKYLSSGSIFDHFFGKIECFHHQALS